MIKYDRFWKTLKEKGISQYNLVTDYNISKSLLQRLRNNEGISTHSLDMLCSILDCRIEDIIEFVKEHEFPSKKQKGRVTRSRKRNTRLFITNFA